MFMPQVTLPSTTTPSARAPTPWAMAGRYATPKWRLPLLILVIGAVAAVLIAFAWHPMVKGMVLGALALVGLAIQFFPAYLELAEKHREERDQRFRRGRFHRWRKALKARRSPTPPSTGGPRESGDRPNTDR